MALDKLVDSTKLDACLDAEADAIRAKTGGSADIPFDYANNKGFADAIDAIPSGGGGYDGAEYVFDLSEKVTDVVWHGEKMPDFALNYCFWNVADANIPTIKGTSALKHIGDKSLQFCKCKIDYSTLSELETIGEYGLAIGALGRNNDHSDDVVFLPKYTGGSIAGITNANTFRFGTSVYVPKTYILPSIKNIPQYAWYQLAQTNMSIQLGSVGHAVESCMQRPFGGSSGTGTVTVYTTGALLDTIKTAIQDLASASYTWIYKAAEATEYGGVSYAAGDTMLTVGGV